MNNLLTELRRRNMFRVAGVYAVAGPDQAVNAPQMFAKHGQ